MRQEQPASSSEACKASGGAFVIVNSSMSVIERGSEQSKECIIEG